MKVCKQDCDTQQSSVMYFREKQSYRALQSTILQNIIGSLLDTIITLQVTKYFPLQYKSF